MKKIIFTFLTISSFVLTYAQPCGTNGSSVCSPDGSQTTPGFQDMSTVPCAVKAVYYDYNLQFNMFDQFNFQGQQSVDSIEFVSIGNLPCGLCWAVNKETKRYTANEDGCLKIVGSTNDNSGQYKLALSLKAWINGNPVGITVPASLVDQTGIRLIFRVKDNAGANCPNADTASNANNLTATTGCPVGISDLNGNVSEFQIMPNPMNNQAKVTFYAEKGGSYTLKVVDVTGKQLLVTPMDVKQGYNETTVERNNLPTGVYFLYLTDGQSTLTKRFTVAE
jgi:hypothetical protein